MTDRIDLHWLRENGAALRARFETDGFVALPGFLDADEIAAVNGNKDRFLRDVVPTMPASHVYFERVGDAGSLKQLQQLGEFDGFFQALLAGSKFEALAAALLGEAVVAQNMQYFDKPAGIGQPTPPHQDGFYFMLSPNVALTMWMALEDVGEEQGCVRYVRGSHKRGLRPHEASQVLGFSQSIPDFGGPDEVDEVAFPCRAGDLLAHHSLTIHRAEGNRSATRSRQALGFIYYGVSAKVDQVRHAAYQGRLAAQLKGEGRI